MDLDALGADVAENEDVRTFMKEIAFLRTLSADNIVRYLGSDPHHSLLQFHLLSYLTGCSVDGSKLNIFEEYVPGGSIASILKKSAPSSISNPSCESHHPLGSARSRRTS